MRLTEEALETLESIFTSHIDARKIAWGAWKAECIESIEKEGLLLVFPWELGLAYQITPLGRAALAQSVEKK